MGIIVELHFWHQLCVSLKRNVSPAHAHKRMAQEGTWRELKENQEEQGEKQEGTNREPGEKQGGNMGTRQDKGGKQKGTREILGVNQE